MLYQLSYARKRGFALLKDEALHYLSPAHTMQPVTAWHPLYPEVQPVQELPSPGSEAPLYHDSGHRLARLLPGPHDRSAQETPIQDY